MRNFKITENNFMKNRIVKYEDDNGNRVLIKSKDNGNELVIKCRPINKDITVDAINLSFPYDVDGINFSVKTDCLNSSDLNNAIADNQVFFQNTIDLVKRWIEISYEIKAFFSNTNSIANLTLNYFQKQNPDITAADIEQSLLGDIVDHLSEYEEMSEFVQFICK